MEFAFSVVDTVRAEEPGLFDGEFGRRVTEMIAEAVEAELAFAADLCGNGREGMSVPQMRDYVQYVADQRLARLGLPAMYGSANPFAFMELQDVQELANFFERRVSAYQVAVEGEVAFDESF
jgi:ribonucleoside-diphosphate reductase beta chain